MADSNGKAASSILPRVILGLLVAAVAALTGAAMFAPQLLGPVAELLPGGEQQVVEPKRSSE